MCLSAVRVLEGDLRRWTDAPAFAYGHRVFVQSGALQPDTLWGQRLLAHELGHVIQQFGGRVRPSAGRGVINDDPWLEAEADAFAERVLNGVAAAGVNVPRVSAFQLPQPVLQCAVGFEFQTGWQAYREVRTQGGPSQRQELPKETALFGGRRSGLGWTMETDGAEIEFVIEPPLENKAAVADVFGRLQFFLLKLEAAGRERPLITAAAYPDLFNVEHRQSKLVIVPEPHTSASSHISAQPQVTVGVRLSRIHLLFEELGRLGLEVRDPTFERDGLESLYFSKLYRDIGRRAFEAGPVQGRAPSPRLRGLMAMIVQYLRGGIAGGTRAYAKDMAYAMARTDFATIFAGLPVTERSYFQQNPEAWVQYALQTAGLGAGSGGERLINQRISDGGARSLGSPTPPVELPLTRAAWLRAMAAPTQPRDLFTADATAGDPLYTDDQGKNRLRALGLLGSKQDTVGHGKEGVIIELRQLRRRVPWPEWSQLAHRIVDYMAELNGRKTDAEQWPPELDSTFQ
jgi:hypothetical protein